MNMRLVLSAMVVASILILSGCDWFGSSKKEEPKLRIVSLLEKKYFDDAHVKGGAGVEIINIDGEDVEKVAKNWDLKVPVVTYCSNYYCRASHGTAKKLKELGFLNVSVYSGGIADWYQLSQKDAAYALEGPANGPAKKEFLDIVIPKPDTEAGELKIVDAQELQKAIKEATV